MTARVDKTVVSGVFSLDGQDFDVDNNVWLVGDDDEVLVIDAPHDPAPTLPGGTVVKTGHGDDTTIAAEVCRVR